MNLNQVILHYPNSVDLELSVGELWKDSTVKEIRCDSRRFGDGWVQLVVEREKDTVVVHHYGDYTMFAVSVTESDTCALLEEMRQHVFP